MFKKSVIFKFRFGGTAAWQPLPLGALLDPMVTMASWLPWLLMFPLIFLIPIFTLVIIPITFKQDKYVAVILFYILQENLNKSF